MMYKLRPFVDKKLLKLIYYTLVYPFVTYALPLIGTADCKYLNSIHILQKRIVRLITYNDDMPDVAGPLSHSLPLFKELEMLTIFDLFKVETSKFVFDCLIGSNPPQFHNYFAYPLNVRNTANTRNKSLLIPQARTTRYGLKSIKNIGARIWNEIPLSIRISVAKKSFVKSLKKEYVDSY